MPRAVHCINTNIVRIAFIHHEHMRLPAYSQEPLSQLSALPYPVARTDTAMQPTLRAGLGLFAPDTLMYPIPRIMADKAANSAY